MSETKEQLLAEIERRAGVNQAPVTRIDGSTLFKPKEALCTYLMKDEMGQLLEMARTGLLVPELLAVLQAFTTSMKIDGPDYERLVRQASAVLAKAEGRDPSILTLRKA